MLSSAEARTISFAECIHNYQTLSLEVDPFYEFTSQKLTARSLTRSAFSLARNFLFSFPLLCTI
jgi:hypothetical protein